MTIAVTENARTVIMMHKEIMEVVAVWEDPEGVYPDELIVQHKFLQDVPYVPKSRLNPKAKTVFDFKDGDKE